MQGWSDVHYRSFLYAVTGVLGFVGVALMILAVARRSNRSIKDILVPYLAWYVMAPVMFLAVGSGRTVFTIAVGLLSVALVTEFARATGLHRSWPFMAVIYIAIIAIFSAARADMYTVFASLPVFFIVIILVIPLAMNQYEGMLQRIALSVLALTYLGWFPGHLALFARFEHWLAYVPFLFIGTVLNDASAFLTGKLLGKHKLIPAISQGKTVEGLIGSLAVVSLYVWSVRNWLPGFTTELLVLSVAVFWIGGSIGDLVASVFKRDIGIKDFGRWIPGHGGLLDRFDSLMLTAPLLYHLLHNLLRT